MSVTFTRTAQSYSPATDTMTSTVTTIIGEAIQVRGKPDTYQRLSLVESGSPTLFFVPNSYNLYVGTPEFVLPGDKVVWASQTYTVMDVTAIAPDGIVIAARIVVTR